MAWQALHVRHQYQGIALRKGEADMDAESILKMQAEVVRHWVGEHGDIDSPEQRRRLTAKWVDQFSQDFRCMVERYPNMDIQAVENQLYHQGGGHQ